MTSSDVPHRQGERSGFLDFGLAFSLVVAIGAVSLVDRLNPKSSVPEPPKPVSKLVDVSPEPPAPPPPPPPPLPVVPTIDPLPRVVIGFDDPGRFGLKTRSGNPDDPSDDNLSLTYRDGGGTNNTRLSVDGATPLLGSSGRVSTRPGSTADEGRVTSWNYGEIAVEQETSLVAGEQSHRMDTLRVVYRLSNKGSSPHDVGLRVMLDTLIGKNDGVPFFVPGLKGIVTSPKIFQGEEVPESIRALERANLERPGVVVNIGLRLAEAERPDRVCLTHWPGENAEYEYDRFGSFGRDTAAGLYYAPRPLAPAETRTLGFTYGLGTLSATGKKDARVSLAISGPLEAGKKFYLVGLVQDPSPGVSARVVLPEGLSLVDPSTATKAVPAGLGVAQVDWLITSPSTAFGSKELAVVLEPGNVREPISVTIRPRDAKLSLSAQGPFRERGAFWVSAVVQAPGTGGKVRLELPDGLTLEPGHPAEQPVDAAGGEFKQVLWLVRAGPTSAGRKTVAALLSPGGIREPIEVEVMPANFLQP